ncbi:MAG: T9SS type A sorting domain-containing protein, partial [Bacteroidetes bacterium]|nr:T9SS type A sorting domain-containing protein [Bacteroidota bacterium]
VEYDNSHHDAEYFIYNALGALIVKGKFKNTNVNQVSIDHLNPGFYLLMVKKNNEVKCKRFVKAVR